MNITSTRWALRWLILLALAIALCLAPRGGAASSGDDLFWVVVASVDRYEKAWAVASGLWDSGYEARISPAEVNGSVRFRVLIGPWAERTPAQALRERLAATGRDGLWLLATKPEQGAVREVSPQARGLGQVNIVPGPVREIRIGIATIPAQEGSSIVLGSDRPITIGSVSAGSTGSGSATAGLTSAGLVGADKAGPGAGRVLCIRAVVDETGPGLVCEAQGSRGVYVRGTISMRLGPDPAVPHVPGEAFIWVGQPGAIYRGRLEIIPRPDGGLTVVNIIGIDDYLLGVLSSEMGPTSPFEALCAQAVVSRTEALGATARHSREGFDLCATTHCQVYSGAWRDLAAPNVRKAVEATRGEVLFYAGAPAKSAKFHASCGGVTESPKELWGLDVPYMQPVLCKPGGSPALDSLPDLSSESLVSAYIDSPDQSVYCYGSNGHRWSISHTQSTLVSLLAAVGAPPGNVLEIRVDERTGRGAAKLVTVRTSRGEFQIAGEYAIRNAFGGTEVIRSGVFVVRAVGDPPHSFEFRGAGYGHGVGMCQYGARAMARMGYDHAAVVRHYYPGAEIGLISY
ncbi:MAG: SpoIID/LytB domain-containing protein [Firmicutes bacterium]|nr:SpoIID/LytB domain-containing protein [Bacillota bacterium]